MSRRTITIVGLVAVAYVLALGLGIVVVEWWRGDTGDPLQPVRDRIVAAAEVSDDERTRTLQHARQLLERSGVPPRDPDYRLLDWTLGVMLDPTIGLDESVKQPDIEAASARTLALSSLVAFRSGRGSIGEGLIGQALAREVPPADRVEVLRSAVMIRHAQGRERDVVTLCTELAELVPTDPVPWHRMAHVYEDRGDRASQVAMLDEYLQRASGRAQRERVELVEALVELGRTERARKELDRLAPSTPAEEDLEFRLGIARARLLVQEGRLAEALDVVDTLRGTAADRFEFRLLDGRLALATDDLERAEEVLEPLVEDHPTEHEPRYLLGQIYARLGRRDESARQLRLHRRFLDLRVEAHGLERRAAAERDNFEIRRRLVEVFEELEMPDRAEPWRRELDALESP